jgi:hypothetical protein
MKVSGKKVFYHYNFFYGIPNHIARHSRHPRNKVCKTLRYCEDEERNSHWPLKAYLIYRVNTKILLDFK